MLVTTLGRRSADVSIFLRVRQLFAHPVCAYICTQDEKMEHEINAVEPGCNDIGLHVTSPIESDFLWYQLIRHS
jgi:hypothetical protein